MTVQGVRSGQETMTLSPGGWATRAPMITRVSPRHFFGLPGAEGAQLGAGSSGEVIS
jgi:hypothetical protein